MDSSTTHLNGNLGQITFFSVPSAHLPQRGDHEHIKRDECRGRIPGKCEDRLPPLCAQRGMLGPRYAGERGWLSRLHPHSPEMDDAPEVALDNWLQKVGWSHRCPARCDENVSLFYAFLYCAQVARDAVDQRSEGTRKKNIRSCSHSSFAMPRSITSYPMFSRAADNDGLFMSYIPPQPSSPLCVLSCACRSTISLPVLRMATTGLL